MDYFLLTDNLTKATGKLDNLTNGDNYCRQRAITSWNIELQNLKKAYGMFYGCTTLTSFTRDLPVLTTASNMFRDCIALMSWDAPLPVLKDGSWMFDGCSALTSFNIALPALTHGDSMFNKCKLDLASVQNIADTINDLAAQGKTGVITIGMQSALRGNADLAAALATIRNKGWTVTEQYN